MIKQSSLGFHNDCTATANARSPSVALDLTDTIQYNTLLTTPHGGFSVTMQSREVTIVSQKTKIDSKTLYFVYMIKIE